MDINIGVRGGGVYTPLFLRMGLKLWSRTRAGSDVQKVESDRERRGCMRSITEVGECAGRSCCSSGVRSVTRVLSLSSISCEHDTSWCAVYDTRACGLDVGKEHRTKCMCEY